MDADERAEKNDASVMVRMPQELKDKLMKAAFAARRRITAEINLRLQKSLEQDPPLERSIYGEPMPGPREMLAWKSGGKGSASTYLEADLTLTDTERTLITLIRRLGVAQQDALLVILKDVEPMGGVLDENRTRRGR